MKKIRSAKTGQYISDYEAKLSDKSTWTSETEFSKSRFISSLEKKSFTDNNGKEVVKLDDIKNLLGILKLDFTTQLKPIIKNLYYISETDSPIVEFIIEEDNPILDLTKGLSLELDEVDFDIFFESLVKSENWFGKEEIENSKQFAKLKNFLLKNLTELKVFKTGSINVDIYILGKDKNGKIKGIQTKSVET